MSSPLLLVTIFVTSSVLFSRSIRFTFSMLRSASQGTGVTIHMLQWTVIAYFQAEFETFRVTCILTIGHSQTNVAEVILASKAELSSEVLQWALRLSGGDSPSTNWKKLHSFVMFHISTWGTCSLVLRAKAHQYPPVATGLKSNVLQRSFWKRQKCDWSVLQPIFLKWLSEFRIENLWTEPNSGQHLLSSFAVINFIFWHQTT